MNFQQKLDLAVATTCSLVCIGLDSDVRKLPEHLEKEKYPQLAFNKAIIDATHDLVCAYKPNSAFYEARGAQGITELKMTCEYLRQTYPKIPVILDAKRGDIDIANEGYITYAFDYLGVDAITLHPYLGREALQPFLDRKDKGCIILCITSNSGAGEFQDVELLYQRIAKNVVSAWNANGNCMLVVGATYPQELVEVRKLAGDMTFLVPGIGTQGGDIEKIVKSGLNSNKSGMIINSSRGIIFASSDIDFDQIAREKTLRLKLTINEYRNV